ncbi:ArsR/SmtB family transcription factor [Streptomyces sp. NPDC059063]|uniref:ArsR/SmtB family transcription factor n=1 Tax=unclassified Streptomyces TaxID=2593676 RepID=UPI00369CCEF5
MTTAVPSARVLEHPERAEIRLEAVLHALSDPLRLRIVCELAADDAELTCSQFVVPVTKSTTTHHFRVLREAGVIQQIYRGTAKLNALRRADLEARFPGLLDSILTAAEHRE